MTIKCVDCGQFISFKDIENNIATCLFTPDTEYHMEDVGYICAKCRFKDEYGSPYDEVI